MLITSLEKIYHAENEIRFGELISMDKNENEFLLDIKNVGISLMLLNGNIVNNWLYKHNEIKIGKVKYYKNKSLIYLTSLKEEGVFKINWKMQNGEEIIKYLILEPKDKIIDFYNINDKLYVWSKNAKVYQLDKEIMIEYNIEGLNEIIEICYMEDGLIFCAVSLDLDNNLCILESIDLSKNNIHNIINFTSLKKYIILNSDQLLLHEPKMTHLQIDKNNNINLIINFLKPKPIINFYIKSDNSYHLKFQIETVENSFFTLVGMELIFKRNDGKYFCFSLIDGKLAPSLSEFQKIDDLKIINKSNIALIIDNFVYIGKIKDIFYSSLDYLNILLNSDTYVIEEVEGPVKTLSALRKVINRKPEWHFHDREFINYNFYEFPDKEYLHLTIEVIKYKNWYMIESLINFPPPKLNFNLETLNLTGEHLIWILEFLYNRIYFSLNYPKIYIIVILWITWLLNNGFNFLDIEQNCKIEIYKILLNIKKQIDIIIKYNKKRGKLIYQIDYLLKNGKIWENLHSAYSTEYFNLF